MKLARSTFATLATVALVAMYGCGKSSSPTSITSLDSTPPPVPEGIALVTVPEFNALTWAASPAADLAKYQVYQYQPDPSRDNAYVLVGETTTPSFRLNGMDGTSTSFRVRAVDQTGNLSGYSNVFDVQVPAIGNGGGGAGTKDGDPGHRISE